MLTIRNYPTTIDPLSSSIDLQICRENRDTAIRGDAIWAVLQRQVPPAGMFVPQGCVHLFGQSHDSPFSDVMLGYGSSGMLKYQFMRARNDVWDAVAMPEEITGDTVSYPSIRLVFRDDAERRRFMRRLSQMEERGDIILQSSPVWIDVPVVSG